MVQTLQQQEVKFDARPKKFVVWLFVVSSTIMFGGWTSYYIVFSASKGKGHGLVLPELFIYSTAVLVASSITMFLASKALRNNQRTSQQLFLALTLILGLLFGIFQYQSWVVLKNSGAFFINNNAAISMIYVLSLFHLFHIFAGICFLINALIGSFRDIPRERAVYRQEIASIFWHFIDILWIYLYVFLLLNS